MDSKRFFSLLLLSEFVSILACSPVCGTKLGSSSCLVTNIVKVVVILFSYLPLTLLCGDGSGHDILSVTCRVSPLCSGVVSILCVLLFLFCTFSALSELSLFSKAMVFQRSSAGIFIILSMLLTYCSTYLKLRTLKETKTVSLFMFSMSFIFVVIAVLSGLSLGGFSPIFCSKTKHIVSTKRAVTIEAVRPTTVTILFPEIDKGGGENFFV